MALSMKPQGTDSQLKFMSIINNLFNQMCQLVENVGAKGFFHLLSANFVIGLIGFGSQLFVAKFLSPLELGQIKVLQSFTGVATIFAGFGFNSSVLKLCSENRLIEQSSLIFKKSLLYSITPQLIVLVSLFISAKYALLSPDENVNKWLPFFIMIIPASVYTSLAITYLQASKKIKLMATLQIFIRTSGIIVIVITTYFFGLAGFILSTIGIGYTALVPLFYLVRGSLSIPLNASNEKIFSQSFYYAKWSVSANAVSSIGKYMDIFMLNYLMKERDSIGYYGLATIFILAMDYITSTVQTIAIPYFSEKSVNKKEFIRVLLKYEKLMILLALSVASIAFIIVPSFIRFIYGSKYEIAGTCFRILTLKYLFWSCYALLGVALFGLGKMLYNFMMDTVFVFSSIILGYFLVTSHGVIGASIAQATSSFIAMIMFMIAVKYILGNSFKHNE
jgi:O-antigen/teichoic acid export membrane protein